VDRRGNPFRENREVGASAGVDLKYRVTSDLTLDMTVNPDFGQVEVDPAQVNLSAIETHFGATSVLHRGRRDLQLRRGRRQQRLLLAPHRPGAAAAAGPTAARDVPDAARILGAAKLTGRTAGGWSSAC
jgi:hypothetical protein